MPSNPKKTSQAKPKKRAPGRPSKYKEEFCKIPYEVARKTLGKTLVGSGPTAYLVDIPPIKFELSCRVAMKVSQSTLQKWRKEEEAFSIAYEEALDIWEQRIHTYFHESTKPFHYYRSTMFQTRGVNIEPTEEKNIHVKGLTLDDIHALMKDD